MKHSGKETPYARRRAALRRLKRRPSPATGPNDGATARDAAATPADRETAAGAAKRRKRFVL
jgi:hypothetical protein